MMRLSNKSANIGCLFSQKSTFLTKLKIVLFYSFKNDYQQKGKSTIPF